MKSKASILESCSRNAPDMQARLKQLVEQSTAKNHQTVNEMFVWLMVVQYVAGIVLAIWITPFTWVANTSYLHLHVWLSVIFGGVLSGFPIYFARVFPNATATRHMMAISQAAWSALLIHLTGGRIETHFHIFASLAFVAFYRDWKVLVSMTVVVAADHAIRGTWWPMSVYGIASESPWRWVEHAAWVVMEDVVLFFYCLRGKREELEMCSRQAKLENLNSQFEAKVASRMIEIEAAKRQAERLALAVKHTDNSVLILDATGKTEWVNRAFTKTMGYTPEEILGKRPYQLLAGPDTQSDKIKRLIAGYESGREFDIEITKYRKDGRPLVLEIEARPILNSDGEVLQIVQIERDITQRIKDEAERSLLNEKLNSAARMAGRAEVATGVIHNVGNVLNSVNVAATLIKEKLEQSSVSLLRRGVDLIDEHESRLAEFLTEDERGKHFPNFIKQVADAIDDERELELAEVNSLMDNIEHIRRIVVSQQSLTTCQRIIESFEVEDLIESAIRVVKASLDRHGTNIVKQIADLPSITSEQHELIQILVNLIKNAQEACDGLETRIVTVSAVDETDFVRIDVADTGVGISSSQMKRMFQHGFTTKSGGHGFGLHAAAITATELGGSLEVHSEGTGMGATFSLRVPFEKSNKSSKVNNNSSEVLI